MTTQKAEALLSAVVRNTNTVNYDVRLALHFIQNQIAVMPLASGSDILPVRELPSLCAVYILDAVIAKVQVALDDSFTKTMGENDPQKAMGIAQELLPATFLLIEAYYMYIRSCLLSQVTPNSDNPCAITPQALKAYGMVISIGSGRTSKGSVLGLVMGWLPTPVRNVIDKWYNSSVNEFPAVGAWVNTI